MAWLDDASKLGIERNISKPHQKIFIKAVAARAMDVRVITKLNCAGLTKEWAGAAIYIANENQQMRVEHVTAFLKKSG